MLAVVAFLRPGESGGVTRFVLTTEGGSVNLASVTNKLDISPDGRTVAYIANSPSGLPGIYLHHLDDLEPTLLLSAQTTTLEFSPDGQSLAFDEALSLRRISIAGGPPTTLVTNAVEDVSVRWSTDGHVYYNGPGFVLLRVPEEGGTPEAVYTRVDETDFGVSSPFVLPGGRAALVDMSGPARTNPHVGYLDLTTGAIDTLIAGSSPRLILDRYMTWVSADGVLLVAPFDEAGRRLEGQGISMVEDVRIEQFIEPEYAVSDNGTLVYRRVTSESGSKLVSVTRDGTEAEYSYPIQSQLGIRLSPDGRYVTFEEGFGVVPDIWTLELATGTRTRITFEAGAFYPAWTPDGRRVAYSKPLQGETGLFWKNSDGSGVEEPLLRDPGLSEVEVVFLPDGERFLVRGGDQSRAESADLLMYEIGSDAPGLPIASAEGNELSPMVSPDGRFVAYSSDELGSAEVFVRSLERPEERWQVSTRGGREPLWHPEGTEIFFRTDTHVFSVPVSTEDGFRRLGEAERLFEAGRYLSNANHTSYEVFPDGDTFLFLGQGATPETVVVLNWLDEVRARLQR
jgi:Tol biopolymer transport system component